MPKRRRHRRRDSIRSEDAQPKKQNKKGPQPNRIQATVYDVVASRINYEGFIKPRFLNEFGEERVRSGVARSADEVLARRRRAPDDIAPLGFQGLYDPRLPDNDLLLAIHQYAADFYCANRMGPISTRSMDETALIAMGLLLEETVEQLLDGSGHLALVDKRAVRDEHNDYSDERDGGEDEEADMERVSETELEDA